MRRGQQMRLLFALAFASLPLLTPCGSAQVAEQERAPATTGDYHIAGTVVDAKSGNPLARARVQIRDAKNRQHTQSVISSDDGQFEFRVGAGKFGLEAAKRGYIAAGYNQHDQFATAIVTGAGLDAEHLVLRISPAATLTGKVLDEHGEPVRNASVAVYREDRYSGMSRIRRMRFVQTDDQGAYEAAGLDEGTYFVSVQAAPWYAVHPQSAREGSASAPPQIDSSLDVAYPITYYGDATEADEAAPIPVRGGDRLEADVHLNPAPALHLLFHVPEDGTHGVSFPSIEQPAFDETEALLNRHVQQFAPGEFEITGIAAGRYLLRMPDADGQLQAPMAVDLADSQELTGASGSSTSKVTFTVQVEGASLPPQIRIGLRNSKGRVVTSQADTKGEVSFSDVIPGKYDVLAGSPNAVYSVVGMTTEQGTVKGRTLGVPAGASLAVSLSLMGGSVTVEGFAKRAGKAAAGAMIVLVPNNSELNHDRFRRDQSDLDGSFALYDVAPGKYTVIAVEDGWDLDWAKPAVLAHYIGHGQALTVEPHASGTQRLSNPVEVEPK